MRLQLVSGVHLLGVIEGSDNNLFFNTSGSTLTVSGLPGEAAERTRTAG